MLNHFLFAKSFSKRAVPYSWLFNNCANSRSYSTHSLPNFELLKPKKNINVKKMMISDLEMVLGWASKEGWNPGKYELEPLYSADPNGYYLLEIDGEPVASLARIKYTNDFAFLGLFIVKPEYRGKGYGKLLWDIVMGSLQNCNTIGLNAVLNQAENYATSGFQPAEINTRWKGIMEDTDFTNINPTVYITQKFSIANIIDYDARIFSTPRTEFLTKWLTMPQSHVLGAVKDGILKGYGVVSTTKEGYKIAPLFADDENIAKQLFETLYASIGEKGLVQIDTNESNPYASDLAKHFKLEKVFDTLRMYKGIKPNIKEKNKIFGLTTLEIG